MILIVVALSLSVLTWVGIELAEKLLRVVNL
jgi:hypothetical protein